MATSGETAQADYAYKVAQIEALQAVGLSGSNIPWRTGNWPKHSNDGCLPVDAVTGEHRCEQQPVWGLAALGLLAGGAVGVWAWRRHGA